MKNYSYFLCAILVASCSNTSEIIVDPSSVTDSVKVVEDREECTAITNNVDFGTGISKSALAGTGVGTVAVVTGMLFVPTLIISGVTGGYMGYSDKKKQRKIKEKIIIDCLTDKGYIVNSSSS